MKALILVALLAGCAQMRSDMEDLRGSPELMAIKQACHEGDMAACGDLEIIRATRRARR